MISARMQIKVLGRSLDDESYYSGKKCETCRLPIWLIYQITPKT